MSEALGSIHSAKKRDRERKNGWEGRHEARHGGTNL